MIGPHVGDITLFGAPMYPSAITAGPDGNLWFTEYSGGRIGRITPAGVVTEFSAGIIPNGGPNGIAAGPDGNLWFTEPSDDRIGRVQVSTPPRRALHCQECLVPAEPVGRLDFRTPDATLARG